MKKSFLWLAGAAVLAACAQTELETVETKEPAKQEIKLDAYMQGQTRAGDTTIGTLQQEAGDGGGFKLAMYKTGETDSYGDETYSVSWDSESKTWSFADCNELPTWPTNSTLDFYAWQDAGGAFQMSGGAYINFNDTYTNLLNNDWVVAYEPNKSRAASTTLNFKHAMTKVSCSVALPEEDDGLLYYIKSIKINYHPYSNYYFYVDESSSDAWTSYDESPTVTMADFTVFETTNEVGYGTAGEKVEAQQLTSAGMSIDSYLIPDPANKSALTHKVTVEYYVFSPATDGSTRPGNLYKAYDTTADDGPKIAEVTTAFNPGEVVAVNITLASEVVTVSLDANVGGW